MTGTVQHPQSGFDSPQALWAADEEPQPPVPWYRQLTAKQFDVGVGAAAALALAVLAAGAMDSGVERRKVALPAEFAGLSRVTEDRDLTQLRAAYESDDAKRFVPRSIQVVAYGPPGTTGFAQAELLAVVMSGSVPDSDQAAAWMLRGYSHTDTTTLRDSTAVTRLRMFEPGPLGGAIACAAVWDDKRELPVCAWADGSSLGSLTDGTAGLSLAELAARTRELRERSERKA
ncbi:hypothetical protein ACIHEI_33075 [Kitasatospora sp. NPDC051984]|uniref:hypothetical protein n=1 Tax=Kitasatospora sp. NPDC051984 TaxID=3364059 RepID=UPI0037C9F280